MTEEHGARSGSGLSRRHVLTGVGVIGVAGATGFGAAQFTRDRSEPVAESKQIFLSANNFDGSKTSAQSWPVVTFPAGENSATAVCALPGGVSRVALDVVWFAERSGSGEVRWAAGMSAAEPTVSIGGSTGPPWQTASAEVPAGEHTVTSTRIGEYETPPDSLALLTMLTRQRVDGGKGFAGTVHVLGVTVTVLTSSPLA